MYTEEERKIYIYRSIAIHYIAEQYITVHYSTVHYMYYITDLVRMMCVITYTYVHIHICIYVYVCERASSGFGQSQC